MSEPHDERSIGDLFAELSRETGTLVRKEIELATIEMTAKAKEAVVDVGMAAAGGALVHAGVLLLLAAVVIGLAQMRVEPWLSALIVAALAMGLGYALMKTGMSRLKKINVTPRQTIQTLKETAVWTTRQGA